MTRTNIVLTDELQEQAKKYEINVSQVCRGALDDAILQAKAAALYADEMELIYVFDPDEVALFKDSGGDRDAIEYFDSFSGTEFGGGGWKYEHEDGFRVKEYLSGKGSLVEVGYFEEYENLPWLVSVKSLLSPHGDRHEWEALVESKRREGMSAEELGEELGDALGELLEEENARRSAPTLDI